jgi:hypothetical protein
VAHLIAALYAPAMTTELMHEQVVTAINVAALFHGEQGEEKLVELFSISFSERDESLYTRPVAPTGSYFCGDEVIPAHAASHEIKFREGRFHTDETPAKLSIHASGQTHVKSMRRVADCCRTAHHAAAHLWAFGSPPSLLNGQS